MSCASLAESPLKLSRNRLVPELAIVPRLSITSASLMPMPLSLMSKVPAAASGASVTESGSAPRSSGLASASKRSFSQASEALEISSRRKISLCEYSEWITNRRTCLVSAWNSLICGCVSVVMAFTICLLYGYLRSGRLGVKWGRCSILQDNSALLGPQYRGRNNNHGENRHQSGCLGGADRQPAGRRREIRGRRRHGLGRHAERGGAFAGRHGQRAVVAVRNRALRPAGRPGTPHGLWTRALLLELRGRVADLCPGCGRLAVRGRGSLAAPGSPRTPGRDFHRIGRLARLRERLLARRDAGISRRQALLGLVGSVSPLEGSPDLHRGIRGFCGHSRHRGGGRRHAGGAAQRGHA